MEKTSHHPPEYQQTHHTFSPRKCPFGMDGSASPCCSPKALEGFPGGSDGKEPACNAGDTGSIPGSGRSAGEGIGYQLQYSWASLVAQLVKNPPAMREAPILFLGWEDPPGNGKATPLQYSGLENSMDCIVHGVSKSWTQLSDFHVTSLQGPP